MSDENAPDETGYEGEDKNSEATDEAPEESADEIDRDALESYANSLSPSEAQAMIDILSDKCKSVKEDKKFTLDDFKSM